MDPITALVLAALIADWIMGGPVTSALGGAARESASEARADWGRRRAPARKAKRRALGKTRLGRARLAAQDGVRDTLGAGYAGVRAGAVRGARAGWTRAGDRRRSWAGRLKDRFDGWNQQPDPAADPAADGDPEGATGEQIEEERLLGPVCDCCGMRHGRALKPGEHCDWCRKHPGKAGSHSSDDPPAEPLEQPATQTTDPERPGGEPGGSMPPTATQADTDAGAVTIVQFWKSTADSVEAMVEAGDSQGLDIPGSQDMAQAVRAHADQVSKELSPLIEASEGAGHKAAAIYQD